MKRRTFVRSLGGSAAFMLLPAAFSSCAHMGASLVATPEKRQQYLQDMLRKLCTESEPRWAGTPAYDRGAAIIKQEMERSLPQVAYDCCTFTRWDSIGATEFTIGSEMIEAYPQKTSPGLAQGFTGTLVQKEQGKLYWVVDPATGKACACVAISPFGKAVPTFYNADKMENLPAIGVGQQDVAALDEACKNKTPVTVKFSISLTPDATACNVAGTMPGKTADEILFMAHCDTNFNTVGAHDNTATVIAMLMFAHALAGGKQKQHHTVTFLATACEEMGSLGAIHYVQARKEKGTLQNIKLFVDMDSLTYGPNLQLQTMDADLRNQIATINNDLGIKGTPALIDKNPGNDAEPFISEGIRGININTRGYDWTLPLWHRPEDTADKVPPELIENAFLVFTEFIRLESKIT